MVIHFYISTIQCVTLLCLQQIRFFLVAPFSPILRNTVESLENRGPISIHCGFFCVFFFFCLLIRMESETKITLY